MLWLTHCSADTYRMPTGFRGLSGAGDEITHESDVISVFRELTREMESNSEYWTCKYLVIK